MLIRNVATQINGCLATNKRKDLTGFEARLTYDRAVDMLNTVVEAFLRERRVYDPSVSAPERAIRAIAILRNEGIANLPDEETVDEAIRQRNRSIHDAHPTESSPDAAAHMERQARQMAMAIAIGLGIASRED